MSNIALLEREKKQLLTVFKPPRRFLVSASWHFASYWSLTHVEFLGSALEP